MIQNETRTKKRACTQQLVSQLPELEIIVENRSPSTLLSSFGLSEEYIHRLQENILSYQANTNEANINFQKDMVVVLDTQKKEIEELIRKQQKEIEILKMDQERKANCFEKKQQELQSMICNLKSEFSHSSQETVSQPINY